jgi:hypothetical protein
MFKNYLYTSSTTETFRAHCAELAKTSVAVAGCQPGDLVLDIASNDGCLLTRFRDIGMRVLGVDPAENLAEEANRGGVPTLCAYWSTDVAKTLVGRFGRPKIITATNVIAHVDDLHEFVKAVQCSLAPRGNFIAECPYVLDFLEKNEFDTAYHEHLSYFGLRPLVTLMGGHDLEVFDIEYFKDIHGGTIRVFVARPREYPVTEHVSLFLKKEDEFGLTGAGRYHEFGERVSFNKREFVSVIRRLHNEGKTIWAYGASAKGNTLMNYFGLGCEEVPVAVDDNPKKWGLYTPGAHMRITGIRELAQSEVDYLILLAWNFEQEIVKRCRSMGFKGGFIRPVPQVAVFS